MQNFGSANRKNKELHPLLEKLRAGKGTQRDMAKVCDIFGDSLQTAMKTTLHVDEFSPAVMREMADKTIKPCLKQLADVVNEEAMRELRYEDKKYGINIGIRKASSEKRIEEVANKVAAVDTEERLAGIIDTDVKVAPRKFYDDFQKSNAELREELGYDQIIIRTYDDVGLHGKHEPCLFCIQREGTYDYAGASDAGVFQRHPGCGCHIEMITNKNTRLTQTQWNRSVDENGNEIEGTGNQWE